MNHDADPNPDQSKREMPLPGAENFPVRFGVVAVRLGYITPEELKDALMGQVSEDLSERPHRVFGIILYDRGLMTMKQLHHTVEEMERLLRERERNSP